MPKDKFEGLTPDDVLFITGLANMYRQMSGHPQAQRFADVITEHMRIHLLLERALLELRVKNKPMYLRLVTLIRTDHQPFLDAVNEAMATEGIGEHVDVNMMSEPSELVFTGLMTSDGYRMRATMIDWLKDKPSAAKLIPLLQELQELLPEVQQ